MRWSIIARVRATICRVLLIGDGADNSMAFGVRSSAASFVLIGRLERAIHFAYFQQSDGFRKAVRALAGLMKVGMRFTDASSGETDVGGAVDIAYFTALLGRADL